MWPCRGFDFTWTDWLSALADCLARTARGNLAADVERSWCDSAPGMHVPPALTCLTVRSAFDLLLRAKRWPSGSEVVFSALTVPDMARIAACHGLRPVALDIDPLTGRWNDADLAGLIGPRTRAVVLVHLFGARFDIEPAIAIARQSGVAVVEDCAQAYAGTAFRGHPRADLSLFSFGPMKTGTALGGGIAGVRCPALLAEMRELRDADPVQPTGEYLRRLLLYGALKVATRPHVFGAATRLAEVLGIDRQRWIHEVTRNVPAASLLERIRQRPCDAMLGLLARRLATGDSLIRRRIDKGRELHAAIGPHVALPTRDAESHCFWMVPVLPDNPKRLMHGLRRAGFDAMAGRLAPVVDAEHETTGARRLAGAVYVPFDAAMPTAELRRLGELATRFAGPAVANTHPTSPGA